MAIKYSIDTLTINILKGKNRIIINGWCSEEDGRIPSLKLLVNGKDTDFTLQTVIRTDAASLLKLKEANHRCGFMICAKNLAEDLDTIVLRTKLDGSSKDILSLNHDAIRQNAEYGKIVYHLDSVSCEEEVNLFTLTGWALSETDEQIQYAVVDENGKEYADTARMLSRDDLVKNGVVDPEGKYCGFMVTFSGPSDQKYKLILKCGDEVKESSFEGRNVKHRFGVIGAICSNLNMKTIRKGWKYLKRYGFAKTLKRIKKGYQPNDDYDIWFKAHRVTEAELEQQRNTTFAYNPRISLLVPTYNTPINLLHEMVDTVIDQSYGNWELCIADGSSPDNPARKEIEAYAKKDQRIKVVYLDKNYGIAGNTNKALELATGDYIAMYDHDDFLELNALFEIVKVLNEKKYDILYTDEDKFSMTTKMFEDPNLKTDFNIDLLLSHNYITHLFVAKAEIMRNTGGFHAKYDGAQDYDMILRCIEQTDAIYHLPKILYHWRMHTGSTAADPKNKMYCYEAGLHAIEDHLERCHISAKVTMLGKPYYGLYHVAYDVVNDPLVSIIIPNYENKKVLKTCVDSLFAINTYKNIEVIIVENNSTSDEIFAYYDEVQKQHANVHVVTWKGGEFNYSAINNYGVQFAKGEYLLFLNNDTEMISPEAIREMLGHCVREEVGVVGAKLLYGDDTVQHAGVVIGFGGAAGHVFHRIDKDDEGYMMRALINCDYSAVTAACMMTKKSLFLQVGGFDEELKVAFNDIDYCLKIRALNKLVVYNAFAQWHHYESLSRGYETSPEKIKRFEHEIQIFQKKWSRILLEGDPYYNPNFDVSYTPFKLH